MIRQPFLFLISNSILKMRISFLLVPALSLLFFSCTTKNNDPDPKLTPEQLIQKNIDKLKNTVQDGDLITRWNDNIISYQIRNLNDSDRSFSHCGIVMTRNGHTVVCNIDANENRWDTVRYDPIDSFINPKENFQCALFRYKLSETEKQDFLKELNAYHERNAHFDKVFDLGTDSLIYCSEMVAK